MSKTASRIEGITVVIDGNATKLTDALKDANKSIKDTQTQLKDVEKLLKLDPKNVNLLKQRQDLLTKSIGDTKKKLDTLKDAQKKMDASKVDKNSDQYRGLQREIADTEAELKRLEKQARNANAELAKVAAVGEKLKKVGDSTAKVGATLTTTVTLPLVAVGTMGAKSFAEVDKTMQLTNKTMGNTTEEAELLNAAMKEAAANSTFGMSDAATATLNFARAGLDAEQAADALAPAMNLAAGEGGNLDTVSAGLVATINGFHGSFEDAGTYADVFAAACNNSALDVDGLSSAMSVAAPIFSAAGYSVNDAALYMGVMANSGIEADKAANSLKTGLAKLVSPAKDGAEMMELLGISVTNADGSMKDSVTMQQELHDAFSKLSESEQIAAASAIFGKNQMAPWLALINTAPADVDTLNASLENCAGTTDEMAAAMMSGFGGSLEQLKSSIDVLVTSLGEALAPIIQKVSDAIQGLVDKFNALSPEQQQTVVKIGLIVAAVGPLLVVIGKVVSTVGTIMTILPKLNGAIMKILPKLSGEIMKILPKLSGAITRLNATLLANPIILIIAGVVALVAAFIILWNKCEGFRNFVIAAWDAIKRAAVAVWDWLKGAVEDIGEFFGRIGAKAGELKDKVVEKFAAIRDGMRDKIGEAKEAIGEKLNNIKGAFESKGGGIKGVAAAVMEGVKGAWSLGFSFLNTLTGGKLGAIVTVFQSKMQAIRDKVTQIWDNIKEKFRAGIDKIKGMFSGWKISLPHIKLPHFSITPAGWKLGDLLEGSIPKLGISWYAKAMPHAMLLDSPTIFGAAGGKLLGGGEAGREVVAGASTLMHMMTSAFRQTLSQMQGAAIMTYRGAAQQQNGALLDAIRGMNSGTGGIVQTINFNQPVQTPDETARAVDRVLKYGLLGGNA